MAQKGLVELFARHMRGDSKYFFIADSKTVIVDQGQRFSEVPVDLALYRERFKRYAKEENAYHPGVEQFLFSDGGSIRTVC